MSERRPSACAPENQVTPEAIMQLGMGFRGAKTLLSAVELGMLEREEGRYANTPATELFLDRAKPSYLGDILAWTNTRSYGLWGSLTEALRTRLPQNGAQHNKDFFDALYADPATTAQFARAMTAASAGAARAIAARFPWHEHHNVIDIGCAEGGVPVQIALAHEHITGGGFDLPAIRPLFDTYVASFGLGDRLSCTVGDFVTDPLPPADVFVMGHILHGGDSNEKRLLLQKAYDALPEGGALIVYDAIIDDERRTNTVGLLTSLNMLLNSAEGSEYTGTQCRVWMREAGFRTSYLEHIAGGDSMVVGIK